MPASPPERTRFPPQIPFIIANEGCERFSFYGMRNILTTFLASSLLAYVGSAAEREGQAKDVFHTFVIGVYLFPLLGGFLADRYFGKFRTILWFSVLYSLGQGCLALFVDSETGFYTGLALIALGSGGIKPLVASFMGDQFDSTNKHLAKVAFDGFYWIINIGSLFASLFMPMFLENLGPRVAFGIPGILMATATVVFYLGRPRYIMTPKPPADPHSFLRVVITALRTGGLGLGLAIAGGVCALAFLSLAPWLELVPAFCLALVCVLAFGGAGAWISLPKIGTAHPREAVEGVRSVLRVLVMFAVVTPFWSLFDQKASTWVLQANDMTKPSWFAPSQMQALNPLLVLILIPLNNLVLFPAMRERGIEPTPLRRMTLGIALAGVAYVIVSAMQLVMDRGTSLSIAWQVLPYVFLTTAEVLVSATGLEFAYSQAPPAMKGTIMSFWNLTVTVGNLWVLLSNQTIRAKSVTETIASTGITPTAFQMMFFAGFAFAAAAVFGLFARRYRVVDHYRA